MGHARPAVSVVIAVRNRAHLLGRALRSALGQTMADIEILVVDDASTDEPGPVAAGGFDETLPTNDRPLRGIGVEAV